MEPGYYEMKWTRGNTFDPQIQAMNGYQGFDLSGSELVFRVIDSSGSEYLRISSDDVDSGISIGTDEDDVESLIVFDIDYTITRDAPTRALSYAVERRLNGGQWTLFKGPLKMITDANDDV